MDVRARFAIKRLVQLGSAAAALASIVGLLFTVGDRASGIFGGPHYGIELEQIALARTPFATYLTTREDKQEVSGVGYSADDLRTKGLAVDFDLAFKGWTKGSSFKVKLLLDSRDAAGRPSFAFHDLTETLNAANDHCVCHTFFFVPKQAKRVRITVQVFRAGAGNSQPLQATQSRWARWIGAA